MILAAYFALRLIGTVRQAPFVVRLPVAGISREPDLQIILHSNPHALMPTYMDGPANICIEVVSPESVQRDHGTKFEEYEKGGVLEYWILDPIHTETRFYRLNEDCVYVVHQPDENGYYETPQPPGFRLHVPTLWTSPLPDFYQIAKTVEETVRTCQREGR